MNKKEFDRELKKLNKETSWLDICISPDFQCDQTEGFPTSLCVNWKAGKAWLELNESVIADMDEPELDYYRELCADYGIRDCGDAEQFNELLRGLGEDAYQSACLPDDEEEGMEQR